jgi:hypothetical protein
MKRQPVTKTFVREECRILGKKLQEQWQKALNREIDGLAQITQRSLKSIETLLACLEALMKKKR